MPTGIIRRMDMGQRKYIFNTSLWFFYSGIILLVCGLWFVVCGSFIRDARAFLSIANCVRLSAVFCIRFWLSPFSCICIRVRRAACSVQLYLYSLAAYGLQLAAVFCIPFRLYSVFLIAFMPFAFMPLRLSFQLYSITLQ